jgi:hypothetical protein
MYVFNIMPFEVKKVDDKYMLMKSDGTYAKRSFKTREAAVNMGKVWLSYRGETPIVKGNKITVRKVYQRPKEIEDDITGLPDW